MIKKNIQRNNNTNNNGRSDSQYEEIEEMKKMKKLKKIKKLKKMKGSGEEITKFVILIRIIFFLQYNFSLYF